MYNKHKVKSVGIGYTIQYKHSLNGKMPRTSTIRSRHNNSNTTHDKGNESASHTKMGCRLEAEERKIIVKKVAAPYSKGKSHKENRVLDIAYRHHSLPYSLDSRLHLIIYSKPTHDIP